MPEDKAREQLRDMFGKEAPSDYQPGDTIQFLRTPCTTSDQSLIQAEVLTTIGPGEVGGKPHGVMLVVDDNRGFPRFVSVGRVVQK